MSVLMGVVGSFVAIIAFSVLLETPGKYLWQTGVVGAIGGGVYLLCTHPVSYTHLTLPTN